MSLETKMAGLTFKNPVLAGPAGITEWLEPTEKWLKAGAGGIIAKSLSADPQMRINLRPTFYTLNRKGLRGAMTELEMGNMYPPEVWAKKLAPGFVDLCHKYDATFIQSFYGRGMDINSWVELAQLCESAGAQGLELDPACPIGLTASADYESMELWEDPQALAEVIAAVKKAVSVPVGVKLSSTVKPIDQVAKLAREVGGADWCTLVNAPCGFHVDVENEELYGANTIGAYIPGPSLKWWSLYKMWQVQQVTDLEISGCGGIWTAEDALQYILMGAPTIQVVTSVYFDGPVVFERIVRGIEDFMERKGYGSIEDFRNNAYKKIDLYRNFPMEKGMVEIDPTPIYPVFDTEKCNFCGKCVTACIRDAITANSAENRIEADPMLCLGCGFCVGLCAQSAVKIIHGRTNKVVWDGEGPCDFNWVNW
jgi:dihydroorotate dehydrogenase/Pyruvate/2-oxoacid:ferredoxin oxidoreductase delta subunit